MERTAYRKPFSGVSGGPEFFGLLAGALRRAPVVLFDALLARQHQAEERMRLRRLSDHQLRDMGLTREDVEEMARKPVWSRSI